MPQLPQAVQAFHVFRPFLIYFILSIVSIQKWCVSVQNCIIKGAVCFCLKLYNQGCVRGDRGWGNQTHFQPSFFRLHYNIYQVTSGDLNITKHYRIGFDYFATLKSPYSAFKLQHNGWTYQSSFEIYNMYSTFVAGYDIIPLKLIFPSLLAYSRYREVTLMTYQ